MTKPLLICEGLAKKFKLRCSGVRNWMGQMLLLRNEEWVNGTMPGLCVAFSGSNSDVKPNDRLPITEFTHEEACTRRRCLVRKNKLKRTTRATQRTQSVTNGYFGGYIGKRQPGGALATRKCIGKLLTLRANYKSKSRAAQLRATSGRLITDIEVNSTYRGAVEVFYLCRNLHPHDVLFAECIRTFLDRVIDGRPWMYRLEASTMAKVFKDACLQNYVPSARRPNVRTDRAKVNECDAYGYRPLQHPWKLFSAYEFLRYWRVVPLLSPSYYFNKGVRQRTAWTAEGRKVIQRADYKDGQISLKPSVHYVAVESNSNDYYLFPEEPNDIYMIFRHSWALERNRRPQVVVIEGLKMPSTSRPSVYNGQYCSLFFRPWTFLAGNGMVPHLSLLGVRRDALEICYNGNMTRRPNAAKYRVLRRKARRGLLAKRSRVLHVMMFRTKFHGHIRGTSTFEVTL